MKIKRILSALLALTMLLTCLPMASAIDINGGSGNVGNNGGYKKVTINRR